MPVTQLPCPKCDSPNVYMAQTSGGRGTTDTTSYEGRCKDCGFDYGELPGNCDGKKDSAIRDWNRHVKESKGLPVRGRKPPEDGRAEPVMQIVTDNKTKKFDAVKEARLRTSQLIRSHIANGYPMNDKDDFGYTELQAREVARELGVLSGRLRSASL